MPLEGGQGQNVTIGGRRKMLQLGRQGENVTIGETERECYDRRVERVVTIEEIEREYYDRREGGGGGIYNRGDRERM